MKFRDIQISDIPEIFQVRVATWHNEHGQEEMKSRGITHDSVKEILESGSHRGWLCEMDENIVGFAMGDRKNGEIWVVAVLKEYEGKGIGRKLMNLVENWLCNEGWSEIWLTTDPDETTRATGFYRHLGWQDWKVEGARYMRKTKSQTT